MGAKASMIVNTVADGSNDAADEAAQHAKEKLETIMKTLQIKLDTYETQVSNTRGPSESKTEIDGGRSIMRVTEMRVATGSGPDQQLKNAIGSFISIAQGGDESKKAAVEGAQALIQTGLDAVLGVTSGQSMEKTGFAVLFINYSFVRVDYFVYSYSLSAKKFGAEANEAGVCYLADLAVLKIEELSSSEIDFLISQSLKSDDTMERVKNLTMLKIQLAQSAVLGRLLKKGGDILAGDLKDPYNQDPSSTLDEILKATEAYVENQQQIAETFRQMPTFKETH